MEQFEIGLSLVIYPVPVFKRLAHVHYTQLKIKGDLLPVAFRRFFKIFNQYVVVRLFVEMPLFCRHSDHNIYILEQYVTTWDLNDRDGSKRPHFYIESRQSCV